MSAWPERSIFALLLLLAVTACAASEPPSKPSVPTAAEAKALAGAYHDWQHALICARNPPSGPAESIALLEARGLQALDRGRAAGIGPLLDRIDADYQKLEATIDWACARGDHLAGLDAASARLSAAVDDAIEVR